MLTKISTIARSSWFFLTLFSGIIFFLFLFLPTSIPFRRYAQVAVLVYAFIFLFNSFQLSWRKLAYCFYTCLLTLFYVLFWKKLQPLFPPAVFGPNQILAYAHYKGISLTGDTVIFISFIILLSLPLIFVLFRLRPRFKINTTVLPPNRFKFKTFFPLIFLFCFTYLLFLPQSANFCHRLQNFDFDSQNILVWDYYSSFEQKPYRDFFYLYGLLFYYKAQSLFWFITYTLIAPGLMVILYLAVIRPFWQSNLSKIVIYFTFLILMLNLLGVMQYSRYGLLLSAALLSNYLYWRWRGRPKLAWMSLGLIAGLINLVSSGDGIYVFIFDLAFFIFVHSVARLTTTAVSLKKTFFSLLSYLFGLLIGLIPLLMVLIREGIGSTYLVYLKELSYISEYAKIPYLIDNFHEVLIISTFGIGFTILILRLSLARVRYSYLTLTLFTALISFAILMLKNVIRPLGIQIDFFAFIVWFLIFITAGRNVYHTHKLTLKALLVYLVYFIVFIFAYRTPLNLNSVTQSINAYSFGKIKQTLDYKNQLCRLDQFNFASLNPPTGYQAVTSFLQSKTSSPRIFSYPYDPIFYLIFKQYFPPYPNAYDASPKSAQARNLQYLRSLSPDYVIYNLDAFAIDQVPDSIRSVEQLRYILQNYQSQIYIKPFLIMSPKKPNNFNFSPDSQSLFPELSQKLLYPDWGLLPAQEGQSKSNQLPMNASNKMSFNNNEELNRYLTTHPTTAKDHFLLVFYDDPQIQIGTLKGQSNQTETILSYLIKPHANHLINLGNLPLFMDQPQIESLKLDPKPAQIWLFAGANQNNIW